jgi:acyl phosphate:glycerol-3-phosphate acyltransferase
MTGPGIGWTLLALALAYLIGSIPSGLWLGLRLRGVDIRERGSKNIGATNTLRVLGKPLGIAALVADIAKGVVAVLVVARLSPWAYAPLACGLAAIGGHSTSVFCRFHGGKGVATSAGVFFSLCPYPMLIATLVFVVVVALTHMVSAGSIAAAATLAVAVFLFPYSVPLRVVVVMVAALVIVRHRGNIQRMLEGQENRLW